MVHYCYLIADDKNHTYIGITNNLDKRISQHNGTGGAKATRKSSNWKYISVLDCVNKQSAESIEWYWKHKKTSKGKWVRTYGIKQRLEHILCIMSEHMNKIEKYTVC